MTFLEYIQLVENRWCLSCGWPTEYGRHYCPDCQEIGQTTKQNALLLRRVMPHIKWHDDGDHYTRSVDDKLDRCVVCNRPLEYSKPHKKCQHKCPSSVIAARQGADTRGEEPHNTSILPSFASRLNTGMNMLRRDGRFGEAAT